MYTGAIGLDSWGRATAASYRARCIEEIFHQFNVISIVFYAFALSSWPHMLPPGEGPFNEISVACPR